MQITATGGDYRCAWTGKRCYCGDCFWGMCICQSLPNCIIHSIVCVIQHFLRKCSDKPPLHVSTPPHCCIPPNLLTVKTRAGVGPQLPFCEACQGRWGAWSMQSGPQRSQMLWTWGADHFCGRADPGDTGNLSRSMWLCHQPTLRCKNLWSSWIGGKQPKALGSEKMSSQEFGVQSSKTPQGILEYVKNVLVVENLVI